MSALKTGIPILLSARTANSEPKRNLQLLLDIDNRLYSLIGRESIRYGGGQHPKQRLTQYLDYFSSKALEAKGPYLDIGCSTGLLAATIATQTTHNVTGIDINPVSIRTAKLNHNLSNLEFILGDVTTTTINKPFNTIILSNVLEHIVERVQLLLSLKHLYEDAIFLIRVPNFERDWRVPLKKEVGLAYFLDHTHEVEHTPNQFFKELDLAGLKIDTIDYKWGEMWAFAYPNHKQSTEKKENLIPN